MEKENSEKRIIQAEDLPLEELTRIGLGENELEALPNSVLVRLLTGAYTPVMTLRAMNSERTEFMYKARVRLTVKAGERSKVILAPVRPTLGLDNINVKDRKDLLLGRMIWARGLDANNVPQSNFVAIDRNTNSLVVLPARYMAQNFDILQHEFKFESEQLNMLRQGKPVSVIINDKECSVGIDLNVDNAPAIRISPYPALRWHDALPPKKQSYNFGASGCWSTLPNGEMVYYNESEYTPEILRALQEDLNNRHSMTEDNKVGIK